MDTRNYAADVIGTDDSSYFELSVQYILSGEVHQLRSKHRRKIPVSRKKINPWTLGVKQKSKVVLKNVSTVLARSETP